jgi:hypothetical protein
LIESVIGFLYDHFFHIVITWLVGLLSKKLVQDMGKDRAELIQEAVATAMYWAEQEWGIATGQLKWEKAWRKIRELLSDQGIELNEKEEKRVNTLIESYVPEINATTYQSVPIEELEKRDVTKNLKHYNEAVEYLRKKYVENTEDEKIESDQNS